MEVIEFEALNESRVEECGREGAKLVGWVAYDCAVAGWFEGEGCVGGCL